MNFSTVPPWRSQTCVTVCQYRAMMRRTASGSKRSPSAVDSLTSLKRIVTGLRESGRRSPNRNRTPHAEQKTARGELTSPQLRHAPTKPVYGSRQRLATALQRAARAVSGPARAVAGRAESRVGPRPSSVARAGRAAGSDRCRSPRLRAPPRGPPVTAARNSLSASTRAAISLISRRAREAPERP